jgi:thiamine-monophosphate kinase
LPQPRVGLAIAGIANAGMDVSDGLVQDLGHICRASGLAAEIDVSLVPLSDAARAAGPDWLAACLTGGDDYELLLAIASQHESALQAAARSIGIAVTRIGRFSEGAAKVSVIDAKGHRMQLATEGWSHF